MRNVEFQNTYEATNLVKEAAGEPEIFRSSPLGIDEITVETASHYCNLFEVY